MACKVTRYDCTAQSGDISRLGRDADTQLAAEPEAFKSIFPWKKQCGDYPGHIHYVSQSPGGVICGWLTAEWKNEKGQKYIYLNEITTRRIKDELYGGVGQRLHAALVDEARRGGAEFIYLYPLNPLVAEVYKIWGYTKKRPEIAHMFFKVSSDPNRAVLDSLMPPHPRTVTVEAHEFIRDDPKLKALLARVRRYIIKNPDLIRELSDAVMMASSISAIEEADGVPEDERMSEENKRSIIEEVLLKVPKAGRRTRKKSRTRRTRLRRFRRT